MGNPKISNPKQPPPAREIDPRHRGHCLTFNNAQGSTLRALCQCSLFGASSLGGLSAATMTSAH